MLKTLLGLVVFAAATACQTADKPLDLTGKSDTDCVSGTEVGACMTVLTYKNLTADEQAVAATDTVEAPAADAVEAAPAAPEAPAPVAADGCEKTVAAKSPAATGEPCLTTTAFVMTLNLSDAQKAKVLAAIEKIDQAAAHH